MSEVRVSSNLKSDGAEFLEINLILGFWGQKDSNEPKTRFSKFYGNLTIRPFLIFGINLL